MIENYFTVFEKLKIGDVFYDGGIPNTKGNIQVLLEPTLKGLDVKNCSNGKLEFSIAKDEIKSIEVENSKQGKSWLYIRTNDNQLICFSTSKFNSYQVFTDVKFNLENIWKYAEENPNAENEMKTYTEKTNKENQNKVGIGCFAVIIAVLAIFFLANKSTCASSSEPNPCTTSGDYIKMDLNYPDEADISIFDCHSSQQADGSYRVLQKVEAKNAFGMSQTLYYEVILKYNGGDKYDINSWDLISIRGEKGH